MNEAFQAAGIELPLPEQGTVSEENRNERGLQLQAPLYGTEIKDRYTWLPGDFAEFVPRMLTELCFGDYMSRDGMDGKTRELLTVVLLAALGQCRGAGQEPCGGRVEGRQLQGGTGLRARARPAATWASRVCSTR